MNLPEWSQWLGAVAGSLIAVGVIWRKGLRPAARLIREFVRAADNVTEHWPTLLTIAEEFKPNGGNSLRDVVDRLETRSHEHGVQVAEVAERVARVDEALPALAENVKTHIVDDQEAFARVEAKLDADWRVVKDTA